MYVFAWIKSRDNTTSEFQKTYLLLAISIIIFCCLYFGRFPQTSNLVPGYTCSFFPYEGTAIYKMAPDVSLVKTLLFVEDSTHLPGK